MRYHEIINEWAEKIEIETDSGFVELAVTINPSAKIAKTLTDNSVDQIIRLVIVGERVLAWDAYYAEHVQVAEAFGFPYVSAQNKLSIEKENDGEYRFVCGVWRLYRNELLAHKHIKRLIDGGILEPQ